MVLPTIKCNATSEWAFFSLHFTKSYRNNVYTYSITPTIYVDLKIASVSMYTFKYVIRKLLIKHHHHISSAIQVCSYKSIHALSLSYLLMERQ